MAEFETLPVRLLCDARASIGETPVLMDGQLLWPDPVERRLLRLVEGRFEPVELVAQVWSLALAVSRLVGTLDESFCSLDPDGELRSAPAADLSAGCRFNDMAVDRGGGLWAGAMHRGVLATRGAIYHAPSIEVRPKCVAEGLGVPNGMKISADGRTLFVVDTLERTLLAYPITGNGLGEPTIVSDFLGLPGKPDGMALADDGSFWIAMWGGGCVAQIAANGATLRLVEVPAPHVSSLCFDGVDRLMVTTSRMRLSPRAIDTWPGSGGVFQISLDAAS